MPATTSVNKITVVHSGSSGVAMSFPDVCKTPSPAGPIPIPYPNVAQSSDTADGTSTVKVDGNPIMLKNSNFKMSTGDEAGAAMGVVSNKIKGKAIPVNASFDVKADGQAVFRLTDPMQTNCGSQANTFNPAEAQAPNPFAVLTSPECTKTDDERKEQEKQNTSWGNCGIVEEHRGPIQRITDELRYVVWFRKTKSECGRWISAKHQPKPHSCMKGTTIVAAAVPKVQAWIDDFVASLESQAEFEAMLGVVSPGTTNAKHSRRASAYVGIVGEEVRGGYEIEPLKGGGRQLGASYTGKWMTGDYDLFQVLRIYGKCVAVSGEDFAKLKRAINNDLHWDAIQHPPQAQWIPNKHEKAAGVNPATNMPKAVNAVCAGELPANHAEQVLPKPRGKMSIIDKPLTVVCGKTVVTLESQKDVVDSLKCKQCGEK
jgi:hypothetical protein